MPHSFISKTPVINFSYFPPWDTPGITILDLFIFKTKHCSFLRAPKSLENIYCHGSLGSPKNLRAFGTSSPKSCQRSGKFYWLAFKFLEYLLKREKRNSKKIGVLLLILVHSPQFPRFERSVQRLSQYINMALSIQLSVCR